MTQDRLRLIWAAVGSFLLGGAIMGLVIFLWLGRGGEAGPVEPPTRVQANAGQAAVVPSGRDIRTRPDGEQLAAAFQAAFGRRGSARQDTGDQTYIYHPAKLVWTGDRAALISLGENAETSHAASGTMAVHYLSPAADGFRVTGSWLEMAGGGTFGAPLSHLAVNRTLSQYPVIYGEGGGTWQGYTCSWAYLVELGPDRPVESGPIPLSYTNGGAIVTETGRTMGGDPERTVQGRIVNIRKGHGFDVVFTGTERFAEHYDYHGNRFARNYPTSNAVC